MPHASSLEASPRCWTLASADVNDDDGIKTSYATVAAPVVVVPADFNGAAYSGAGGVLDGPGDRFVTITRSNNANQFSVAPIVMVGFNAKGVAVSTSVTPANDDGNDVLTFATPIRTITSISFPAQGGAGGTFKIGVNDIVASDGQPFRQVRGGAAGNVVVGFVEGGSDTLPCAAGEHHDVRVARLYYTNTTAWPVTLYQ